MPATVNPLPAPPDPNSMDASTFSAVANTFTQALPAFGTQINAVATEVNANANAAAASATSATGAANYRGDWSAGTAYTLGQSVSYLGQVFIAKVGSTGVTPVDGATWNLIRQGFDPLTLIRQGVI